MAVSVGGQALTDADQLSPKARCVLGFVAGGAEWLEWAVESTTARYSFASEEWLLDGIQSGLHGDSMLLLRALGLQVSSRRLWQLDTDTLESLASAVSAGGVQPDLKTKKALSRFEIWTFDELANGQHFLDQLGVGEQPVFQALTLLDRIDVFNLSDSEADESSAAANFAVGQAVNPSEFVDLYQFYQAVAGAGKPAGAQKRVAQAQAALEPLIRGLLKAPFAPQDLAPPEAGALARTWIEGGNPMGFATVARGLKEIARFANGAVADEEQAAQAAAEYDGQVRALLLNRDPGSVALTQDGSVQLFPVAGRTASAVLSRHRYQGTLTVRSFEGD